MENLLDFCGQKWKPRGPGVMTLFLSHVPPEKDELMFVVDFSFVPLWVDEEAPKAECRVFHVGIQGFLPQLMDWRRMACFTVEAREGRMTRSGKRIVLGMNAPEIELWSSGMGKVGGVHRHAKDGRDMRVVFGEWEGDGYELPCQVEAFYPSEQVEKAATDVFVNEMLAEAKEAFGEEVKEGWQFSYCGRVRFNQMNCTVPINTADPIGWAKNLTRQNLQMPEFGFCYVNGGDRHDGSFKPEDGITDEGRLVILNTPTASFHEWQEKQTKTPKAAEGGTEARGNVEG